jgi:ion channel-forming bestrophin family protein
MLQYDRRDWVRQLFTFRGSVLPMIAPKVIFISLLASALVWLEKRAHVPELPLAPFTVLGTALGLLLTFRTNSSYDRFWEGRKAWGCMVNRSRNLARQASVLFEEEAARLRMAGLIALFAHASKRQLWKEILVPEATRLVDERDAASLEGPPGPAVRVLVLIGEMITLGRKKGWLDSIDQERLEADVTWLIDQLGVCERIQKTPLPIGYALHLRRFLIFYCLAFTLALVDPLGWYAPLAVGFVAYAFLGIERVGIEIEDPFEHTPNDLDLEALSCTIERDVFSILGGQVRRPETLEESALRTIARD